MVVEFLSVVVPKSGFAVLPIISHSVRASSAIFPALYRESVIEQKKKKWKSQCPSDCRLGIDGKSFFIKGNTTIH